MLDSFSLDEVTNFNTEYLSNHYTFNGKNVPRVTEIIQACLHEDYLLQWANSLGFKRQSYNKTLQAYADYGTDVHNILERYIKGEEISHADRVRYSNPISAFESWWNQIHNGNIIKVLGQEFSLVCAYYGGTYDMLLEINGEPWLVDFKTSNSIGFRYNLQLAAYRAMLKNMHIVDELRGTIILRVFKDKPKFEEYVLDLSNESHKIFLDDCERLFNSMAYQYYWRKYLESEFSIIRRKG